MKDVYNDISELEGMDNCEVNDGITQKTIEEWKVWLEKKNVSVIWPAMLYVDVYRIREDGTEVNAFAVV